ncbi:MAG: monomethylamine:corrinoid methyltransferase, partial [Planctomycetes bacterium]|nr:monomethylamine:corrinoid methyltransferase [Planctomycetota bacterium]
DRALTGPVMEEDEFNLAYSQRLRKIVTQYEIAWPKEQIIPDAAIADKIFEAAVELIAENGLFHMDTKRVVQFTRQEVIETAKTRPRELTLGEGKDAMVLRERTPDSAYPPAVFGNPGMVTEDMFIPITLSHAIEPTCNGIQPAVLQHAWGMDNKGGTPGELYCVVAESEYNRMVARLAGKPGMPFLEPDSATTPFATVASFMLRGYTKTGSHMPCHVFGDLKVSWERLNLAALAQLCGIPTWNGVLILVGAFARNAAEQSVAQLAGLLGLLSYTHGNDSVNAATDLQGQWSGRENLRATAAIDLALERNVHIPAGNHIEANAGACTEMACYEIAAQVLAYASSGVEFYWGAMPGKGMVLNGVTGMETRILGETAHAVAGIGPERANELLNKVLERYEGQLANAPKGKTFVECYDVATIKPSDEYLGIWASAKEGLSKIGISFKY